MESQGLNVRDASMGRKWSWAGTCNDGDLKRVGVMDSITEIRKNDIHRILQ